MQRVADAAATLSLAEDAYRRGRIPLSQLDDFREIYKAAYRMYTDPFGSKTYA